jgi:hypothetical protein
MPMDIDEITRRKESIAARHSDVQRWSNPDQLERSWEPRSQKAAARLPQGATVYDLGCGAMLLEKHLHPTMRYVPCDLVMRDERTLTCDLNAGELPQGIASADRVTMLGVLEYIFDVRNLLAELHALKRTIICSYCCSDYTQHLDRRALGWVNDYSFAQLAELVERAGYRIKSRERIDPLQELLVLTPGVERKAEKRVVVLSCSNVTNFGDRLGYHNICTMLPDHATVEFIHHNPWQPPAKPADLLILGVGNSIFGELLTEELQHLVDRSTRSIGIFGTQYRELIDREKCHRLIDSLDHWFARYEDDVLLYGRGRQNVSHLGDWLIANFAMTTYTRDGRLVIGEDIWRDLALDRVIQQIQSARSVLTARLHPLLCALTSAETVEYVEQREIAGDLVSGKFASMLIDVFGRTYPEKTPWSVDREPVRPYKRAVAANMEELRRVIAQLLD